MTTITIERELLEQAIGERNLPMRQIQHAILALRAALAAPEQCWCDEQGIGEPAMRCVDCPTRDYKGAATAPTTTSIEDHTLERLLDAWDTTVLPKHRDGAMQEWMEALRHEFMTCPDNSIKGRVTSLAAPESGAMAEIDYTDDDALRFIQRVLESNAPESDIRDARNMVVGIRTRVLKARADRPAPEQCGHCGLPS